MVLIDEPQHLRPPKCLLQGLNSPAKLTALPPTPVSLIFRCHGAFNETNERRGEKAVHFRNLPWYKGRFYGEGGKRGGVGVREGGCVGGGGVVVSEARSERAIKGDGCRCCSASPSVVVLTPSPPLHPLPFPPPMHRSSPSLPRRA